MRRVLKKIANDDHELGDISTMADGSVVEVDSVLEIWFWSFSNFDFYLLPGSLQLQRRDDAKQEEQINCFFQSKTNKDLVLKLVVEDLGSISS